VVGNVGAPGRINYTLIGDTVERGPAPGAIGQGRLKNEDDCIVLASAATVAKNCPPIFPASPWGELLLRGMGEFEVYRFGVKLRRLRAMENDLVHHRL